MSDNNTCVKELSCADSPLSMAASIIGILTLAYAVLITILFQLNALAGVEMDTDVFIRRLREELESMQRNNALLSEYIDRIPEATTSKVKLTTEEAAKIVTARTVKKIFPRAPGPRWLPWSLRRLFRRNTFLMNKQKLDSDIRTVIEKRLQAEEMCRSALNRLVDLVSQI